MISRTDLEISARSDTVKFAVREDISSENSWRFHRSARRIILIHGFNTEQEEAYHNFRRFRRQAQRVHPDFEQDMFGFTWPGDEVPYKLHRWFVQNVSNAEDTGKVLGKFLGEHLEFEPSWKEYIIIAHSLGCYVVLEAIRELRRLGLNYGSRLKLFFMAAAFPHSLLDAGAPHELSLSPIPVKGNFHSPADRVLRRAFPAGHFFKVTEASGLNGLPGRSAWAVDSVHAENYRHADYWNDEAGKVVSTIAREIGYRNVVRPEPYSRAALVENEVEALPPLVDRHVPRV